MGTHVWITGIYMRFKIFIDDYRYIFTFLWIYLIILFLPTFFILYIPETNKNEEIENNQYFFDGNNLIFHLNAGNTQIAEVQLREIRLDDNFNLHIHNMFIDSNTSVVDFSYIFVDSLMQIVSFTTKIKQMQPNLTNQIDDKIKNISEISTTKIQGTFAKEKIYIDQVICKHKKILFLKTPLIWEVSFSKTFLKFNGLGSISSIHSKHISYNYPSKNINFIDGVLITNNHDIYAFTECIMNRDSYEIVGIREKQSWNSNNINSSKLKGIQSPFLKSLNRSR